MCFSQKACIFIDSMYFMSTPDQLCFAIVYDLSTMCLLVSQLLYKYAQSHVGYGAAPTVPAEDSGVRLTEDQKRLFACECAALTHALRCGMLDHAAMTAVPGKIHNSLRLGERNPRSLG
jgi:hypothetical protein